MPRSSRQSLPSILTKVLYAYRISPICTPCLSHPLQPNDTVKPQLRFLGGAVDMNTEWKEILNAGN
jgi:hypothetical protein